MKNLILAFIVTVSAQAYAQTQEPAQRADLPVTCRVLQTKTIERICDRQFKQGNCKNFPFLITGVTSIVVSGGQVVEEWINLEGYTPMKTSIERTDLAKSMIKVFNAKLVSLQQMGVCK